MSSANKDIADRIIAGEFPEDNIVVIIRYENMFNGNYAYKIVTEKQATRDYLDYLLYDCPSMGAPEIYWKAKGAL